MQKKLLNSRAALGALVTLGILFAIHSASSAVATKNFRLYLQIADDSGTSQIGVSRHTDFLNAITGLGFAPWASDSNGYNPDALRVNLNLATLAPVENINKDFRVCLQFADNFGLDADGNVISLNQAGAQRCTPWATEGGGKSEWAADTNAKDPDGANLEIETRALPEGENVINDIRVGLQLSDVQCTQQFGNFVFTPWASDGGGWSNWAKDNNGFDFDCGRVVLEVKMMNRCTEAIACANNKVLSLSNNAGSPGEGTQYMSTTRKPTAVPSIFTGVKSGNLTYEAWVYKISNNSYGGLIGVGDSDMKNNGYPALLASPDGKGLTFRYGISKSSTKCTGNCHEYYLPPDQPIPTGVWTHIAVTVSDGKTLEWYVRGGQYGQATLTGWNLSETPRQEKIDIGNDVPGASEYSDIKIDELRIWNYARSAEQIQETMNRRLAGTETGLLHYWNFDAGATDLTGNSGAFGAVADLKNGAALAADPALNPLKLCTKTACPAPEPEPEPEPIVPPPPVSTGDIMTYTFSLQSDGITIDRAPANITLTLDAGAAQPAGDAPVGFLKLSVGGHILSLTDKANATEYIGFCSFARGETPCSPTGMTIIPAAECSAGRCIANVLVGPNAVTNAIIYYYTGPQPVPISPPPPPPDVLRYFAPPLRCGNLICEAAFGETNATCPIDCPAAPPPPPPPEEPACTFSANKTQIIKNVDTATLTWNCVNGTGGVTISPTVGAKPAAGSVVVGPEEDTTYTLRYDEIIKTIRITVLQGGILEQ